MSTSADRSVQVDFSELEAMSDVIEAARCYWHRNDPSERAAETLKAANRLFWTVGEYLQKTGEPSERFQSVRIDSTDGLGKLVDFASRLASDYAKANDPWFADTIRVSNNFANELSHADWQSFSATLSRMGLTLHLDSTLRDNQMLAAREDRGPWQEGAEKQTTAATPKQSAKTSEDAPSRLPWLASLISPTDILLRKAAGSSVKVMMIQPERLVFSYEVRPECEARFMESVRRLIATVDSFQEGCPLYLAVSKMVNLSLSGTDDLVLNEWRFEFQVNADGRSDAELEPMIRSQLDAFRLELETYLFE